MEGFKDAFVIEAPVILKRYNLWDKFESENYMLSNNDDHNDIANCTYTKIK